MALRCLIVDDNAEFLAAARDLLEREGVTVVGVASTTAQALQRTDALRPQVVLVDVELGDESGFDLARRLADQPDPVRVVLISTYAENDLDELVQTSPVVGFLSKRDVSRRAIDALLDGP
ncbi:MAG TPA: response regulator [Baekduia sp.]|nr:response regulator [Baekduia sp.]